MTDDDDPNERRRALSLAGRGYRALTDQEADHLAELEQERRDMLQRADALLRTRNAEMRRLFNAGVAPSDLARVLPADKGEGTMSRSTADRIVRGNTR